MNVITDSNIMSATNTITADFSYEQLVPSSRRPRPLSYLWQWQ